ncbi:MAG: hypothetical protein IPM04_14205 [Saprospiraceae bacterium]|nr:hypothetical protein [Candidatus Brachybacter algidus]MBK8748939.1 hypothetical protein [Candidatus Brachybacter algidus]
MVAETEFEADTNTHGEKRAFVVSGQYESLLPMDIYSTSHESHHNW